jgi:AraC-like DNA-binding protein
MNAIVPGRSGVQGPAQTGGWRAVSWSWSAQEWAWLPIAGPPHGSAGPSRPVSLRVDTRHAPASDRFDLWRDVTAVALDYLPTEHTPVRQFHGSGFGLFADGGRHFVLSTTDPYEVRRSRRQAGQTADEISFGLLFEGERWVERDGASPERTLAGEFFVDDGGRSFRLTNPTAQRSAWLALARSDLAEIFPGDIPDLTILAAMLRKSRLAPLIHGQFSAVARHGGLFTDVEGGAAIAAMSHLILAAVAAGREEPSRAFDDRPATLIAARRYIETHLADPELGVDSVAEAVGCSRAALYRAFAAAGVGMGVAETIRELRLQCLRALLEGDPVSVGEAAARCGFSDPRALQRRFKERFGLSPRDVQRRTRTL